LTKFSQKKDNNFMPKNSQKGFAPIIIIVVIAIVVAAGVGGFVLLNKGKLPSLNSVKDSVSQAVTGAKCDYDDKDLCKFITNWKVASSYKVTMTTTVKDGSKSDSIFELSGEDKFHMVASDKGKEVYNVITLGDTTYTKDYTDNKWWKQKATKDTTSVKDDVEFKVGESTDSGKVENKTTYKSLGKEACGSLQCFKYQVIEPEITDTTEYIWFDDKDYLLRKVRSEGKDGTTTEMIYSYDKVTITEPTPTKEIKS
jgi:hypothetical protein